MVYARKFSRLPFSTDSVLTFTGETKGYSTRLLDISLKGALLELPKGRAASVMERARLQIHLQDSEVTITIEGEVAHTESGHLGLYFVSIDIDSITHLRRMMELNLGDPGLLERELLDLGK